MNREIMRGMGRKALGMAAACLVLLAMMVMAPAEGRADLGPYISFNVPAKSGSSIAYAGGNGVVVGQNIAADTVTGVGTQEHASLEQIIGSLVFQTGNLSSYDQSTRTWKFTPGTIDLSSGNSFGMISGSLSDVIVTDKGNNQFSLSGNIANVRNQQLATYYGFNPQTTFAGTLNLSFTGSEVPGFSGSVGGGTVTTSPVPLPGSALLFIPGALALVLINRKREGFVQPMAW